jgi:hypothetical protein
MPSGLVNYQLVLVKSISSALQSYNTLTFLSDGYAGLLINSALKGRDILTMGAAHRGENKLPGKALKGRNVKLKK